MDKESIRELSDEELENVNGGTEETTGTGDTVLGDKGGRIMIRTSP